MKEDDRIEEHPNINDEYKIEDVEDQKIDNEKKTYKVIIIGNSGVGKSCISFRVINKKFDNQLPATISLDVSFYKVKVNNKIIQIQFWDTCGNDEFAQNTPNLFKNSSLAIIVYALNNRESFEDLGSWNNILTELSFECMKYLVGNKSDLKRVIEKKEVEKLIKDYEFSKYFETSAKSGFNIKKLMDSIAISIYEKYEKEIENKSDTISLKRELHKKKSKKKIKGCCN
jgi:small GTP-binding protein